MHRNERVECMKTLSRLQGSVVTKLHSDASLARVGHGNWERDQTRPRFKMADCHANIPAPHIYDGRASAVVAGVHTEIVLLCESGVQRDYPVWTALVGAALECPKSYFSWVRLSVNPIGVVAPAESLDRRLSRVGVAHIKDRKVWEFVVNSD